MKKSTFASVVFPAGLALALLGCAASTAPSTEEARGTQPDPQQRIASTTLALEQAFDVQFEKGHVDPNALQPLVYDVLQAMPEEARPQVEKHIYDVISIGQKDASEMTPEQRAHLAAPVGADKLGRQQLEIIGAWGWGFPGMGLGFGGLGGFGLGAGFGTAATFTSTTAAFGTGFGFPGIGFGGFGFAPCGLGLGLGFGGLGAFGFPGLGFGMFGFPGFGLGFGGLGLGFGGLGFGGLGLGFGGLGFGVPGGFGF